MARSDGLTWICDDLRDDGTHPSRSGAEKVGSALLDFMLASPLAEAWFRSTPLDGDADGIADSLDLCPDYPSTNDDIDGNGIGDECECGDQNGDGTVSVADILAINAVIFGQAQASELCDTTDDQLCNVADILGLNARIFGAPGYCSRYPAP